MKNNDQHESFEGVEPNGKWGENLLYMTQKEITTCLTIMELLKSKIEESKSKNELLDKSVTDSDFKDFKESDLEGIINEIVQNNQVSNEVKALIIERIKDPALQLTKFGMTLYNACGVVIEGEYKELERRKI